MGGETHFGATNWIESVNKWKTEITPHYYQVIEMHDSISLQWANYWTMFDCKYKYRVIDTGIIIVQLESDYYRHEFNARCKKSPLIGQTAARGQPPSERSRPEEKETRIRCDSEEDINCPLRPKTVSSPVPELRIYSLN